MSQDDERRFSFASSALGKDDLEVVSFSGREALSELYAFDVVLVSRRDGLDLDAVAGAPATLTLHGRDGSFAYHGLASFFELTGRVDDFSFYRTRLVPKAFPLSLGENNRIFLDKKAQDFLTEVLREEGLAPGLDFELRLSGEYPEWPYVSQFRESSFAFASRWMERDGLYYFFEQGESGAKMVVTDSRTAHQPLAGRDAFLYRTPSGLDQAQGEEGVYSFVRRLSPLPESVLLKDWNFETPSVDLSAEASVLAGGHGAMRFYGDHFRTVEEGRALAEVRSQELACRRDVCEGRSSFPGMTAGGLMSLDGHFRDKLNRRYLITSVRHEGRQFGFLTSGLGLGLPHGPDGEPETFYRNFFTAIPSDVQFRPERRTPWPRLEGLMTATIDGEGAGQYAEVDGQGRYKIKVAYDRSGRGDGKASHWVRMAQPYAGDGHGMHFPLHKGCEAVFACVDGNPDRPVLLGAVPNPDHKSVVTDKNQTMTNLQTAGGNQICFEDKEGTERALWQSKANQSFMRLGSPNDPPSWYDPATAEGTGGIVIKTPGNMSVICGDSLSTYMIGYFSTTLGLMQKGYLVSQVGVFAGFVQGITGKKFDVTGSETELGAVTTRLNGSKDQVTANKNHLIDELIAARGRITTLDTDLNQLRGQVDLLAGQCDQLAQDVTTLAQEKTELCGAVTNLAQEKTRLCQTNTALAGEVQDLADSKIGLYTELTQLSGQVNDLAQQATALETERTELFANINNTCGTINRLADLDLVV